MTHAHQPTVTDCEVCVYVVYKQSPVPTTTPRQLGCTWEGWCVGGHALEEGGGCYYEPAAAVERALHGRRSRPGIVCAASSGGIMCFFPDSERKTLSPGFCERIQLLGDRYRSMAEMASFDVLVKYFFGFLDGIRNLQIVQTYARVG